MMAKCIAQPRSLHPTPIRINVHNLEKYEVTLLVRDITGQTKCHDAESVNQENSDLKRHRFAI